MLLEGNGPPAIAGEPIFNCELAWANFFREEGAGASIDIDIEIESSSSSLNESRRPRGCGLPLTMASDNRRLFLSFKFGVEGVDDIE